MFLMCFRKNNSIFELGADLIQITLNKYYKSDILLSVTLNKCYKRDILLSIQLIKVLKLLFNLEWSKEDRCRGAAGEQGAAQY